MPPSPAMLLPLQACEVPTMVGHTLFRRLAGSEDGRVTRDMFTKWWASRNLLNSLPAKKLFEILRKDGQDVRGGGGMCGGRGGDVDV